MFEIKCINNFSSQSLENDFIDFIDMVNVISITNYDLLLVVTCNIMCRIHL